MDRRLVAEGDPSLAVVMAIFTLLVPIVVTELPQMRDKLPELLQRGQTYLAPWLASMGVQLSLDPDSLKAFVLQNLDLSMGDGVAKALASLRIGGSVALALIGHLILVPVALYYLLMDGHHMLEQLREWLPRKAEPSVTEFVAQADEVLGGWSRPSTRGHRHARDSTACVSRESAG